MDPRDASTTSTVSLLRVEGMTCNHCARKVTDASQGVPGVASAAVSLKTGNVAVRWKSAQARDIPAILAAVHGAGFEAREIQAAAEAGHGGARALARWQINLWFGLGATALLMAGEWGLNLAAVPWFRWLSFALGSVVQFWCGWPFYRGAWRQLRVRASDMDTLVALGSSSAYGLGCWQLFRGPGGAHLCFMEASAIIAFVSLGHWLEARVTEQATSALRALLTLVPATARRLNFSLTKDAEQVVPVGELRPGDLVALKPGDQVPTDGLITSGESAVDESMLTGEPLPQDKKPGGTVSAGTVNLSGRLVMRVTATGAATALARVIAAVERAQASRGRIQRLGDRASSIFVPVILAIAVATGLWWGFGNQSAQRVHDRLAPWLWHVHLALADRGSAWIVAAAVLIVACPCAMGLATPAAVMAAANAAARRGFLIRDAIALEKAGKIDTVIFDKTGTLTEGKPSVERCITFPSAPSEDQGLLLLAAALARNSAHPISLAIGAFADPKGSAALPELPGWKEIPGAGVQASLPGEDGPVILRLGSLQWLLETGVETAAVQAMVGGWAATGATTVGLSRGQKLEALFSVKDKVKPGAAAMVATLRGRGLSVHLLSGDNPRTAVRIAEEVGIPFEQVIGGSRPEAKAAVIKQLQNNQRRRVAYIGDGINDAPALAQADMGIVVNRASDIAREAADIVLLKSELEAVPEALALAREARRIIVQNLFWAFFYNALGVPLAALGFMSPIWCAAAMGCSDLVVIGNALRLLKRR